MIKLPYVTANERKFRQAVEVCAGFGIELRKAVCDVDEIQAEDGAIIAADKAAKIYATLNRPVVISDDSWSIPGLNGFPGPYLRSMNHWLTVDDWLRLTTPLKDRRIILRQFVVYQDADGQHSFHTDVTGQLLPEARGRSPYPLSHLMSFDGGEHSNAELHALGRSSAAHRHTSWHEFAEWYGRQA